MKYEIVISDMEALAIKRVESRVQSERIFIVKYN